MTITDELNAILADDPDLDRWIDARTLLCDPSTPTSDLDSDPTIAESIRALIAQLESNPYARHELSMLLLDFSLCPMHRIDYAACFDDRDDECALIREYFPNHDT